MVERGIYKDNFDTKVAIVTLFICILRKFPLRRSRVYRTFENFSKNSQFLPCYNFFVICLIVNVFRYFRRYRHNLKSYVFCFVKS